LPETFNSNTDSMSRADWENVARCARARYGAELYRSAELGSWMGEWTSWQAALSLSGRCPI
jgi:hypothetical protein